MALARLGRFGYLLKDRTLDVDDFLDAVARVAAGGTALDHEVVERLLRPVGADDPLDGLTVAMGQRMPVAALAVPGVVVPVALVSAVALAAASGPVPGVFLTDWPYLLSATIGCLGSAGTAGRLWTRGEPALARATAAVSLLLTASLLTAAAAVQVIGIAGDAGPAAAVLNALVAAWRGPLLIALAVLPLLALRRDGVLVPLWTMRGAWALGILSGVLTALFYGPDSPLASTPPVVDAAWTRSAPMTVAGNALFQACVASLLVVPAALWIVAGRAPRAHRPTRVLIAGGSSLGLVVTALALVVVMPWRTGVDNAAAASAVFSAVSLYAALLPAAMAMAILPGRGRCRGWCR